MQKRKRYMAIGEVYETKHETGFGRGTVTITGCSDNGKAMPVVTFSDMTISDLSYIANEIIECMQRIYGQAKRECESIETAAGAWKNVE